VRFRGHLIQTLIARGFDVHVAAPGIMDATAVLEMLRSMGAIPHTIEFVRGGTNPLSDLRGFLSLVALIRRIRPTYVLGYTIKPVVYGMMAARLFGVPRRCALVTGLGQVFDTAAAWQTRWLARLLYWVSLRQATCVMLQNPDDLAYLRAQGILKDGMQAVVIDGSGIDTEEYGEVPLPSQPSFVMISRLIGAKGVREYAAAAAEVRRVRPQTAFRLVGWIDDGPDAITSDELRRWQEDGNVEYVGRVADVRQVLKSASVFVLPSAYGEGLPRTILEAMAMGRAIITTDWPGCRETVRGGENGILVPPRNVEALVQAMLHLVDAPELVAQMGSRSRQIAVERYDVRLITEAMLKAMGID
jgi:glycosyltransferase involved in cell wall biosynthesis